MILLLSISRIAAAGGITDGHIEQFTQGDYVLTGKKPDSGETYSGKVSITNTRSGLVAERFISGVTTSGTVTVEYATADKIPVLRIRYSEHGDRFEETCIVDGDLDNYARISCLLYIPGKNVSEPGMEALFIIAG